jgi:rubrerythrin
VNDLSMMLRIGIELERRCRQRYHDLARFVAFADRSLSDTFRRLADEEESHARMIEELHLQFVGEQPNAEMSLEERVRVDRLAPWSAGPLLPWVWDVESARHFGARIERDMSAYYRDAASLTPDRDLRDALEELSRLEGQHLTAA